MPAGLAYALAAFLFWGAVPIYWKYLAHVPPIEIVLHRILWSSVLIAGLITRQKRWDEVKAALKSRTTAFTLTATTFLIGSNWFLFIWAVNSGRLLETSLGYFMTPIINIILGQLFLKERLSPPQLIAVTLAAAGVLNLMSAHGAFPWLAVFLAVTFGLYGLLRKKVSADALVGLGIETFLLALPAAGGLLYFGANGSLVFLREPKTDLLLLGTALITTLPLLWFSQAVRRLEMKAVAFTQYLSPICHFLLAIFLFHEPLGRAHLLTFLLTWGALLIYSLDAALAHKKS